MPSMSAEIKQTYEEKHVECRITDLRNVKAKEYMIWESSDFPFANTSWCLNLYTGMLDSEFMVLYLEREEDFEHSVEYTYGLKKLDGSVERLFTDVMCGSETETIRCELIKLSEVLERKSELGDDLTITCTLRYGTIQRCVLDKPKLQKLIKLDTLSENFKDLFTNKESCDTTLRVGDIEYKVHKAVLVARTSVFAATFRHETSEKQTGVITIPDCEPETFKDFLEFLYCGQIEKLSYHSAFHLYKTSDKYDIQELKTFCIDCLMENLTVENVCEVVIMADHYDEAKLLSTAQDFFNENVDEILETSEWECFMKKDFRLGNKLLKEMPKVKVRK